MRCACFCYFNKKELIEYYDTLVVIRWATLVFQHQSEQERLKKAWREGDDQTLHPSAGRSQKRLSQ